MKKLNEGIALLLIAIITLQTVSIVRAWQIERSRATQSMWRIFTLF